MNKKINKKDINFFDFNKIDNYARYFLNLLLKSGLYFIVVIFLLVGGIKASQYYYNFKMNDLKKQENSIMSSEAMINFQNSRNYVNKLIEENQIINQLIENLKFTYKLSSTNIKNIYSKKPENVFINSLKYVDDSFELNCTSTSDLGGAKFSSLLRELPEVESVNYIGSTITENISSFKIVVRFKEQLPKENPQEQGVS